MEVETVNKSFVEEVAIVTVFSVVVAVSVAAAVVNGDDGKRFAKSIDLGSPLETTSPSFRYACMDIMQKNTRIKQYYGARTIAKRSPKRLCIALTIC